MRLATALIALPGVVFVLIIFGAVPCFMAPTQGQALWAIGFAQSMANHLSIFATDIGQPEPASIAFGLPAVLTIALFLKVGLNGADAYSLAFAAWLTASFWGAYQFSRTLHVGRLMSIGAATLWMSTPILWAHNSYSMLVLGFALLPFYLFMSNAAWQSRPTLVGLIGAFLSATIAVFMDGYSFMCFALVAGTLWVFGLWTRPRRDSVFGGAILAFSFGGAAALYMLYVGTDLQKYPLDFFRAYGANIEFWLIPTRGLLWAMDTLGVSVPRSDQNYFGDPSVYMTTFALTALLLAVVGAVRNSRRETFIFLSIASVALYLALGPSFKWFVTRPAGMGRMLPVELAPIPTGTAWLSEHVPGFSTMRASYRWTLAALFALWAAFVASTAHQRSLGVFTLLLALVGVVMNFPGSNVLTSYRENRTKILAAEAYADKAALAFKQGERVVFLPWDNDFYVTYLAPRIGVRAFNIGGDKNLSAAFVHWPKEIRAFPRAKLGSAEAIKTALSSHSVDAIALSFISNFIPVFTWPVPDSNKEAVLALEDQLKRDPHLAIARTDQYIIVRLANE